MFFPLAARAQAVTLKYCGYSSEDIEKLTVIKKKQLQYIIGEAKKRGYNPDVSPTLKDEYFHDGHPNRPTKLSKEQIEQLIDASKPTEGVPRKTNAILAQEFGVSERTIRRFKGMKGGYKKPIYRPHPTEYPTAARGGDWRCIRSTEFSPSYFELYIIVAAAPPDKGPKLTGSIRLLSGVFGLALIRLSESQGRRAPSCSSSRSATSSRPRRPRPILESSDVEQPPGRQNRRGGRDSRSAAREVSATPADGPPEESFMIDGFNNDDRYRMVEDEFLDVAKEFTQHLHAAEYKRMKDSAKAQNAATINAISRPVTTKMGGETSRKVESIARAKKQAGVIKDINGDQPPEQEGDSDESQGPWLGTALQGLMEKPRASAVPLADISGFHSTSKAAAGYKGSSIGRMETYDVPDPEEFEHMKPAPLKPTEDTGETETETEDDDDDLAAAPVVNQKTSYTKKESIERRDIIPESREARQSEIKSKTIEPSSYGQEEPTSATGKMSAESMARIARRREQARIKRMKEEEDTKEAKYMPKFQ
ncbi:hypothetical protein V492_02258 [Pseudogymnoascus sp. VKM F-4246]|nr:hypothetical protein V492_02258 [Pseudogymnoascus sp. VKM F-4246]